MIQNAIKAVAANVLLGDDRFSPKPVNVVVLDFSGKELVGVDYLSITVDGVQKTVVQAPR